MAPSSQPKKAYQKPELTSVKVFLPMLATTSGHMPPIHRPFKPFR